MDPLDVIKDWGGWAWGAVATFFTIKAQSDARLDQRIDARIEALVSPAKLEQTLERMERKLDIHGEKLEDVKQRISRVEGQNEQQRAHRHQMDR